MSKRILQIILLPTLFAAALSQTGCGVSLVKDKDQAALKTRLRRLETQIRKKEQINEELKEKNFVLTKKMASQTAQVVTQELPALNEVENPVAQRTRAAASTMAIAGQELSEFPTLNLAATESSDVIENVEGTGEHFLYAKVLESFRSKNQPELQKATEFLLKSYAESAYSDNALYLCGLMAFEKNDLKNALHFFNEVLEKYPQSNKTVTALLAKGVALKKMGHPLLAKNIFNSVKQIYPGSPEAQRASMEIRQLQPTRSRE